MPTTVSPDSTGGHFNSRGTLQRRTFLTQLPLSILVVFAAVMAMAFYPQSFREPLFMSSLLMHALLLLAAFAVPWDKLPRGAFLIIPYLDFLAIGLLRFGHPQFLSAIGLLIFFPVFWLASSGLAKRISVVVSVFAALLIVWIPVFGPQTGFTLEQLVKPVLFPLVILAFAIMVIAVTKRVNLQRKSLEAKDLELRAALEVSRQRERLLSTVLGTVAVGLVVVDADGHDVLMNDTQTALHSLALPENIADPQEKDLLLFGPDTITEVPAQDRPVRRAIEGETFTDYQMWLGTGETKRAVSTTARPMYDAAGAFDGAVIVFHDITKMMAALESKNDFVEHVSHEFRTPLTSIHGYLEMVLEDTPELPDVARRFLGIAARNVERLNALVADLLTADAVTLQIGRADVAQLIEESLGSAAPTAAANKVTLVNAVEVPLQAFVDARRIGQVLDNFVSNAVKYSPDGGTVTVRAWSHGADLWCEVQDTGMGMNSAEQAEAFTKFFRAKSAMQRSIPGIGLGLMISRTIVAKHGGTISLHSKPGVGSTIGFMLPGCLATKDETAALERINPGSAADAGRARPVSTD
ncbi:sensor histidine kinase [Arthrobacter antibioticus]|uniref:sensor histidine kinase n=1 Tax=Arthrobacter sp. H35-MC1 TaxID=3046203 RepID=UPI0024BADD19|nr:ATP-binding protein [Arthrobacter sp. H35-MC1]MDJ0317139.1 ATP-binding protein [Arthrobacter sp. H35-MC1]